MAVMSSKSWSRRIYETVSSNYNMTEEKAKQFAINAHGKQQYGSRPYSFHLESVALVAKNINLENDIILKDNCEVWH